MVILLRTQKYKHPKKEEYDEDIKPERRKLKTNYTIFYTFHVNIDLVLWSTKSTNGNHLK